MWHDDGGWHVRVTHRGDASGCQRTITTPGEIAAERVLDERGDRVGGEPGPSPASGPVSRTTAGGRRDFRDRCAPRLNVSVRGDGRELRTNRVFLATATPHPTSVPFVIERSY